MGKQLNDALIRQLWLKYFNRILFQKSIISESAYQQILFRICKAGVF